MNNKDIFDTDYIDKTSTNTESEKSEMKKFLKSPITEKEFHNYGTSKPRRVIIRGKISGR
ncbi:hypothetical protein [Legionella bozemanae]|uniref:hypothetical protein n=1 Tax=Legionella bozemanae TaxID=447 RepID=UPI0010419B3B|nr:hypothetical protein [Legionella bozemanae]HEO1398273.1 hypothetical protein [Legionella pneumophila]